MTTFSLLKLTIQQQERIRFMIKSKQKLLLSPRPREFISGTIKTSIE